MKAETEKPIDTVESNAMSLRQVEDPIVKFLEAHWQRALYALIAAGFLLYLYFGYQRSQEESRRQAADLFNKVRASLTELETADAKLAALNDEVAADKAAVDETKKKEREERKSAIENEIKSSREKLHQRLSALSDVKEPYRSLAKLYGGMASLSSGDVAAARNDLRAFNWQSIAATGAEDRLIAELAALTLARTLIEQEESRGEGEKLLGELANDGSYVKVSAALALARIAGSPEKKSEAKAVLEKIRNQNPEYADLVREQIERLSS